MMPASRMFLAAVALVVCTVCHGSISSDLATTPTAEHFRSWIGNRGDYMRITLRYRGAYKITGQDLEAAGADLRKIKAQNLALWNEGRLVPVLVDSRSSQFETSDTIRFLGDGPPGTFSTYRPHNLYNVYYLTWDQAVKDAQYSLQAGELASTSTVSASFDYKRRLEKDTHFWRTAVEPGITDNFFWLLHAAGREPKLPIRLSFPGLDPDSDSVSFLFRFFGLTEVAGLSPHHEFVMSVGETPLGKVSFNGIGYYSFETSAPVSRLTTGAVTLETPAERSSAVDSVAIDWVELDYWRMTDAGGESYFEFSDDTRPPLPPGETFLLHNAPTGTLLYAPQHKRVYRYPDGASLAVPVLDGKTSFTAVGENGYYEADNIVFRSGKKEFWQGLEDTDVLVLYHPRVEKSARFYQQYRQLDGQRVQNVSVLDIYDALDHGFASADAIKRFVRYVAKQAPEFKYLVLFGDATGDSREANYAEREGLVPDASPVRAEDLIPIRWIRNPAVPHSGGYPDDNWYGSLGNGNIPDIAVGRIPVNNDVEGFGYARKILEYEQLKKAREDKLLLVASVEQSFQEVVMEAERDLKEEFTTSTRLFPIAEHATEEILNLRKEFEEGIGLLYYVGHGGSFVWRVGPTDFARQKDLFTPADVAKLKHKGHYPIVACSSCYTTSFDADYSLGEALLLQPDGGAIALIGTPWKSTVYEDHAFNRELFKQYRDRENTRLGDIFLKAKQNTTHNRDTNTVDFQSFTLLGDPCLKLVRR